MREHVKAREAVRRARTSSATRRSSASAREDQPYKVELIEDLVRDETSTRSRSTRNGPFTDLCRGPHAPDTGRIKAFKLLSLAGAYWRGDAEPPDAHAHLRHRVPLAGKDLDGAPRAARAGARARPPQARHASSTCSGSSERLAGLAVLAPGRDGRAATQLDGAVARGRTPRAATARCKTPILYDAELWQAVGPLGRLPRQHVLHRGRGARPFGLKPMNCPAHIQLYKDARHSYRDLPMRYSRGGPRAPPRAERHAARPAARAPHHAGRRAHLLHARTRSTTRSTRCLDFGYAIYDTFGFDAAAGALDAAREARSAPRTMWDRAEAALDGALGAARRRVRAQPGRRRVLRAEDRPPHDRLDRPLVAAAARSSSTTSMPERFELTYTGARQRRAPPGDDPPRAAAARSSASSGS